MSSEMPAITDVHAREILDSRGNPTVEVEVWLESGAYGRAARAVGRLDGQARGASSCATTTDSRYGGKGVRRAVQQRRARSSPPRSRGSRRPSRPLIDRALARAGRHAQQVGPRAPTRSSASRSPAARAAADDAGLPLYQYLGGPGARILPVPLMNVLNGGAHADNGLDVQEFMLVPAGAGTFSEALRMGVEIFHTLKRS